MPLRLRCHLRGPTPRHPFQHARGLQARVLRWLDAGLPGLGALLHRGEVLPEEGWRRPPTAPQLTDAQQAQAEERPVRRPRAKPYGLSPLYWDPAAPRCLAFDLCLLADWLLQPLQAGLTAQGPCLTLGDQPYRLLSVEPVAPAVTWEALQEDLGRPTSFAFRLLTPTVHHAAAPVGEGGERPPSRFLVAPSPECYFGSWLNRWNLCAPQPLDPKLLELAQRHLELCHLRGETMEVELGQKDRESPKAGRRASQASQRRGPVLRRRGFVGEVAFGVVRPGLVPPEGWVGLGALARFSGYCGTGLNTQWGLGQTEPLGGGPWVEAGWAED